MTILFSGYAGAGALFIAVKWYITGTGIFSIKTTIFLNGVQFSNIGGAYGTVVTRADTQPIHGLPVQAQ